MQENYQLSKDSTSAAVRAFDSVVAGIKALHSSLKKQFGEPDTKNKDLYTSLQNQKFPAEIMETWNSIKESLNLEDSEGVKKAEPQPEDQMNVDITLTVPPPATTAPTQTPANPAKKEYSTTKKISFTTLTFFF